MASTIIGDLYDALGGSTVNFLITYDPAAQKWFAYFGDADKGGPGDRALTADMGILVGMLVRVEVRLNGNPLVSDGNYPPAFSEGKRDLKHNNLWQLIRPILVYPPIYQCNAD